MWEERMLKEVDADYVMPNDEVSSLVEYKERC